MAKNKDVFKMGKHSPFIDWESKKDKKNRKLAAKTAKVWNLFGN
jgi:hypothetical protein